MNIDDLIEDLNRLRVSRGNLDIAVTYGEAEAELSHLEVSCDGRRLELVLGSMLLPEDPSERWMEEHAEVVQP